MSRRSFRFLAIPLFAGLLAAPGPAGAGRIQLPAGKPELAKVSSHLLRARALAAEGRTPAEIAAAVRGARLRDGLAQVQVSLERLTPEILERLRAGGLVVDGFHFDYAIVDGRIDLADLDKIAAVADVATIHPAPRRGTRIGAATNQADATMNTDDVRAAFPGNDGTGVRVGILSDSFRNVSAGTLAGSGCTRTVTGTASQTSGDVPNLPGDVIVLDDGPGGGSDEGRAIAELIADVAPGAQFLFHSAFNGNVDFAAGIAELIGCGAELIVDDVFYTREPFFQDGVIADAAQQAFNAGVPYFSAAGNDATFGIYDVYNDSNPDDDDEDDPPTGDDLHDFDPGPGVDRFAAITLPNNCSFHAELQWSEPFDGTQGDGASSDLDLYVLSTAETPSVANELVSSVDATGCGAPPVGECADGACHDPVEIVEYDNDTGMVDTVFLAVEHFCGDEGVDLRIVTISFDCNLLGFGWNFESGSGGGETEIFVDGQIFGHPAAKDVLAVAAAFYGEIDAGGALDVEPFTSRGGDLPFYFKANGDPLSATLTAAATRANPPAPETRFKPDITSADGVNTTFFGCPDPPGDPCVEGDNLPNFFGTSAAAPNATALAVLIWQLTGELISPRALHQLIEQAVLDMELPGPDDLSGTGFADGLLAAHSLGGTTPLIDDLEFDLDGDLFLTSVPSTLQPLKANTTLTLGNGNYDGLAGMADQIIFADGFESGDTSSWSN